MVTTLKPPYEYSSDVFSQNGEDGIIRMLFDELKIQSGLVLEVGAHNGIFCSNTRNLYLNDQNFKAILIEGENARIPELIGNSGNRDNTELFHKFIVVDSESPDSIDSIIAISKFKNEPFVLASIDLDGPDFDVWSKLKARPILVVIETPLFFDIVPGVKNIIDYIQLGKEKGYTLFGMSGYAGKQAGNLFFLENSYAEHFTLPDIHDRLLLSGGLPCPMW